MITQLAIADRSNNIVSGTLADNSRDAWICFLKQNTYYARNGINTAQQRGYKLVEVLVKIKLKEENVS